MGKLLLFEVNTRYWLYLLRKQYGPSITLATIPQNEIDTIAKHYDWLWLMGIWDHSKIDKEFLQTHPGLMIEADHALEGWSNDDIIGSPYAIKTYNIHPMLGTEEDYIILKSRLNNAGVKVMLDFVPNHFGFHSPHAMDNPDYFINFKEKPDEDHLNMFREVETKIGTRWIALGKDPYFAPWDDTFQVNYRNQNTRNFMIKEILKLSSLADGIRCDMAMLVNNDIIERTWGWLINGHWDPIQEEFWPMAIKAAKKKNPNFIFMAEVYWDMEWELLQMGFDYAYDKLLYDRFIANDVSGIHAHLTADLTYQTRMCRFIENHDEPRALSKMHIRQSLAAASIIMTLPGITLLHQGQLEGNKIKIPVQLIRKTEEPIISELNRKYHQIMTYSRQIIPTEAIWHLNDIIPASELPFDSLFSWTWQTKDQIFVIAVNYAEREADGIIKLNTDHPIFSNEHLDFVDFYNDERYEWYTDDIKKEGLYVKLEDYGYHLFIVETIF